MRFTPLLQSFDHFLFFLTQLCKKSFLNTFWAGVFFPTQSSDQIVGDQRAIGLFVERSIDDISDFNDRNNGLEQQRVPARIDGQGSLYSYSPLHSRLDHYSGMSHARNQAVSRWKIDPMKFGLW